MGLKVNVQFKGGDLAAKFSEAARRAEHIVAQQIKKDTEPYVPMSATGTLNTTTRVEENKVIYDTPYARFLYEGKVMVYPPTGSTWAPANEKKVVTDRPLTFSHDFHQRAQDHWFEASKAQNMDKWERVAEKALKEEIKKEG